MLNKKIAAVAATAALALTGLTACNDSADTANNQEEADASVASEVEKEVATNSVETTYEDTGEPIDDETVGETEPTK